MSGGGSQTTTQTQSVPQYLQDAHQNILGAGGSLANTSYQPYTGPRIAGWTADQTAATDATRSYINGALGTQASGFDPNYYTATNPDVAAALASAKPGDFWYGKTAADHYNMYGLSEGRSGTPMSAAYTAANGAATYQPQQISLTPQQAQAATIDRGAIRDVSGTGYTAAQLDTSALPQVAAQQIAAGQLRDTDLDPYMNPYRRNVVDTALSDMARQNDILQTQARSGAVAAGAYGGSRATLLEAENNRNLIDRSGAVSGQLMDQAYQNAQNAALTDIGNRLTADRSNQSADLTAQQSNQSVGLQGALANMGAQNTAAQFGAQSALQAALSNQGMDYNVANTLAGLQQNNSQFNAGQANQMGLQSALANQSAGLQAANLGLSAANTLAGLQSGQNQQTLGNLSALYGLGSNQQQMNQANIDLAYQDFLRQQGYPQQQLQSWAGLLNPGMGMGGTTTSQVPTAGWLQGGLGAASTAAGIYRMLGGQGLFGSGVASSLMPNSIYDAGAQTVAQLAAGFR